MRSNNVTHIIDLDASLFAFAAAAESQHYRPRYAVQSGNGPAIFMETGAPRAQQIGAMGVGSVPAMDTDDTPNKGPAAQLCLRIMTAHNQDFTGKATARALAYGICDAVRLIVGAATSGGGLMLNNIVTGVGRVGPRFVPGAVLQSALTADHHVLPGAGLDLAYQSSCTCYRYTSNVLHSY